MNRITGKAVGSQRTGTRTGKVLRSALFTGLGVGLAMSLSASAEWRVYDDNVERELQRVNEKLESQNKVGSGDFQSGAADGEQQGRFKDPPKKFTTAEQDQPSTVVMTEAMRCPKPLPPEAPQVDGVTVPSIPPGTGSSVQQQQWNICKEIYETERAQFKYSLMMSELAQKRYERLQQIQQQRGNINSSNVGELTSNTNKMLALLTLIQIDQQQHKTYNDAYAARLAYLNAMSARLGQQAVNGTRGTDTGTGSGGGGSGGPGPDETLGDWAAMGVMTLAFADGSPFRAKRRGDE